LQESVARLGTWVPFARAAELLAHFAHTTISEPTVRRTTEAAGAAYVAVQAATLAALEREAPAPPPGPPLLQLSADGAMVPLVGRGAWAEVKTLTLGAVQPPAWERDRWVVHTTGLSYFSRLADHEAFTRAATVEAHRRGVATAGRVVAVNDGAAWIQELVDYHRPDAVRILDWGHAAQHLGAVAAACFAAEAAATWRDAQLTELLEGDPDRVLGKLRGLRDDLVARATDAAPPAALDAVAGGLQYLEARRAQIAYAAFRALGYPIGSGAGESAHKVVMQARLKGAGMHWARHHVDPMLALRTVVCNDRWAEAWPQIAAELRRHAAARRRGRRLARRPPAPAPAPGAASLARVLALPDGRHDEAPPGQPEVSAPAPPPRPSPRHPWRRYRQHATVT